MTWRCCPFLGVYRITIITGASCEDARANGTRHGVRCSCEVPAYLLNPDLLSNVEMGPYMHSAGCESLRRPESLQAIEEEVIAVSITKRADGSNGFVARALTLRMNGTSQVGGRWQASVQGLPSGSAGHATWLDLPRTTGAIPECRIAADGSCQAPLAHLLLRFSSAGQREQSSPLEALIVVTVSVNDGAGVLGAAPAVQAAALATNPISLAMRVQLFVTAEDVASHARWSPDGAPSCASQARPIVLEPLPLSSTGRVWFASCDIDFLPVQHQLPASTDTRQEPRRFLATLSDGNRQGAPSIDYVGNGQYSVSLVAPETTGEYNLTVHLDGALVSGSALSMSVICQVGRYPMPGGEHCGCPRGMAALPDGGCAGCGAGTFKGSVSDEQCSSCAPGTFSSGPALRNFSLDSPETTSQLVIAGAAACSPCAPGSVAPSAGSSSCASCPSKTYASAATSCLTCPPFTTTAGSGALSAEDCVCDRELDYHPVPHEYRLVGEGGCGCRVGSFYSASLQSCAACPMHTTSHPGRDKCSLCSKGSFLWNLSTDPATDGTKACAGCPQGAICEAGSTIESIVVSPGWWRFSNRTTDLRRCDGATNTTAADDRPTSSREPARAPAWASACLGGATVGTCAAAGQGGPLCRICSLPGKYYDGGRCERCPLAAPRIAGFGLLLLGLSLLLGAAAAPSACSRHMTARMHAAPADRHLPPACCARQ